MFDAGLLEVVDLVAIVDFVADVGFVAVVGNILLALDELAVVGNILLALEDELAIGGCCVVDWAGGEESGVVVSLAAVFAAAFASFEAPDPKAVSFVESFEARVLEASKLGEAGCDGEDVGVAKSSSSLESCAAGWATAL